MMQTDIFPTVEDRDGSQNVGLLVLLQPDVTACP
jgi:hypothetical protein